MFKKLLATTVAMIFTAAAVADISLSGLYEGTLDNDGEYTQSIETTIVGNSGNSAVTVVLDSDFSVDDMYVTTTVGPLSFLLGDNSGDDPDEIKMGVTFDAGPVKLGLNQVSGGDTSVDASGNVGGISLAMTDITAATRETTAGYSIAGFTTELVHSKVGDDHRVQSTVSTALAGLTLTGESNQNADRDAWEDGSWGGSVASVVASLGTVKAEGHITSADVKTLSASLTRGIWTAEWSKTDAADAVVSLKASLSF